MIEKKYQYRAANIEVQERKRRELKAEQKALSGTEYEQEIAADIDELTNDIKEVLEQDPRLKTIISRQWRLVRRALVKFNEIKKERSALLSEKDGLLKRLENFRRANKPVMAQIRRLKQINKFIKENYDAETELLESSPEAFYALHLLELKRYKEQLIEGGIVETPYVQDKMEDVISHLRLGKPVMIYGHLGSGKSELAMHTAAKYSEKPALIVSGSKHMDISELYGHQVLSVNEIDNEKMRSFIKRVEREFEEWCKHNPTASEEDINRAHDRILQIYQTGLQGGTFSEYFLGPIYRAMQEGRVVIIDEVNAIPHEVLISLNHILTRKAGDIINVQQNSGTEIRIKEGFGIIMTGNLNQGEDMRYVDRQELDPAFLSRLHKIEYDYLPQLTEGSLEQAAGAENELFQLILAKVMDRHGNIDLPHGAVRKLWNLAKAARVIQDVFAGKAINQAFYYQVAGGHPTKYYLQESVLSIRGINSILDAWISNGFTYELDYYLWHEFVNQSTVISDKVFLYQLLQDRFDFFQSANWPHPEYDQLDSMTQFDITAPHNEEEDLVFMTARQTVEYAYGEPPEVDDEYYLASEEDEDSSHEELAEVLEVQKELINKAEELKINYDRLNDVLDELCQMR